MPSARYSPGDPAPYIVLTPRIRRLSAQSSALEFKSSDALLSERMGSGVCHLASAFFTLPLVRRCRCGVYWFIGLTKERADGGIKDDAIWNDHVGIIAIYDGLSTYRSGGVVLPQFESLWGAIKSST